MPESKHRFNLFKIHLHRFFRKKIPMLQASEMPDNAKHHASEKSPKGAIERSLVIEGGKDDEPRRGSIVVTSMPLTTTDRLRRSCMRGVDCCHQAARPCDCVGKTVCMVFRIIRHLRCLFPHKIPINVRTKFL